MDQISSILSKISIRQAKAADFSALVVLGSKLLQYDNAFDASIDLNWLQNESGSAFLKERLEGKGGVVFLAEDGQKPIAYAAVALVEAESYRKIKVIAELEELFVLEEYRRAGIGKKLVEQFSLWAKESNAEKVSVIVSSANLRSIDFYRRMGFLDYDLVLEKQV